MYVEEFAALREFFREVDISLTWGKIAGRVVVSDDDRGCLNSNSVIENNPGIGNRAAQSALADLFLADDL